MRRFLLVLTVLIVAATGVTAVSAQEVPNGTAAPTETPSADELATEAIDQRTALLRSDFADGELRFVLISDEFQRVTVTDAGAVLKGGEVPQKRVTLREGRNRVVMPVTTVSGKVAVTIATEEVLYSVVERTSDPIIAGPFTATDAQQSALGGGVGVAVVTAIYGFRRVYGLGDGPRRKL